MLNSLHADNFNLGSDHRLDKQIREKRSTTDGHVSNRQRIKWWSKTYAGHCQSRSILEGKPIAGEDTNIFPTDFKKISNAVDMQRTRPRRPKTKLSTTLVAIGSR